MNEVKDKNALFKKDNFESLLSGLFCFFGSILGALVATGFDFSLDTFKNPAFYISTLINFGIMMYVYNLLKAILIKKQKKNKDGQYFKSKEREERIIKEIRDNHLESEVERIVAAENELRRKNAAQELLDNVTYGLKLEEIENLDNENNIAINSDEFNKFCKKRGFEKKRWWMFRFLFKIKTKPDRQKVKALKKAINNVLNGKYYYEVLTTHDLLVDTTLGDKSANQMRVDEKQLEMQENKTKSIMFIVSTTLMNSLIWQGINDKFWVSLLSQAMLILSSMVSAYTTAAKRMVTLTTVSENKCGFLNNIRLLVKNLVQVNNNVGPLD